MHCTETLRDKLEITGTGNGTPNFCAICLWESESNPGDAVEGVANGRKTRKLEKNTNAHEEPAAIFPAFIFSHKIYMTSFLT